MRRFSGCGFLLSGEFCWWSIFTLVQLLPFQAQGLWGERTEQLRHVRRHWVWNQFFVQEEHIGLEPLYVGKLHSDLDTGDGSIEYVLTGEGAGTVFTVDVNTGDLHAMRRLDREAKAHYTLRAQALHKHTGQLLEPESAFTIRVLDINDNEPKFQGTSVIQLKATDADDPTYGGNAVVAYSLVQGQPQFSIEARTGILRVSLPSMDREQREQYHVIVQAKDTGGQEGGLTSTATVTVTLSDINDSPPRFTQELYQMSISESAAEGSVIGYIRAEDQDVGVNADMCYSIVGGDGQDIFDISTDPTHRFAIITVKKALDFETRECYTLQVAVANTQLDSRYLSLGPFTNATNVTVTVEDVSEPPVFCEPLYYVEVPEDLGVGVELLMVSARDPDVTNDSIRYFIERSSDPGRFFSMDTFTGSLLTERALDREEIQWHNITVLAMELNDLSQIGSVSVIVKVKDVNDNPPRLWKSEAFVCNDAESGKLIHTLRAVDLDDPDGIQRLYYSLEPEASNNPNFSLRDNQDNTAGIFVKRGSFSIEEQTSFHLTILVWDEESPIQTGTSTLTLHMCQCEENGKDRACSTKVQELRTFGLTHHTLAIILACVIIPLAATLITLSLRKWHRRKSRRRTRYPYSADTSIRENIVIYNDEGGGEADTKAFDLHVLWEGKARQGAKCAIACGVGCGVSPLDEYILVRLKEVDADIRPPPYDSIRGYAYEGEGSRTGSLSPLHSSPSSSDQDYEFLKDWGLYFRKLALLYGVLERKEPL
ncbi:cadherin-20-like isoform X2 [Scleropages formosus]|uniref:cadherin-20-like isoform X2 n=1 Tax=Scleropages formosus TaxID=113540 RepID=UPI000877FD0D|nr:cadherin-20-like isoform X2 [Scleropages formosus]